MRGWITWAPDEEPIAIADRADLESTLRAISKKSEERPRVAFLELEDGTMGHIGLGRDESIVMVHEPMAEDGATTEWIAVGDPTRQGYVEFFLLGEDHSEYEERSLLPIEDAIRALGDLLDTGKPAPWVRWEENSF